MFYYLEKIKGYPFTRVFFITVLFLLIGCAGGRQEFQRGESFELQGNWDDAITYYEAALRRSPGNAEFRNALQMIRGKAAREYYEKAQTLMEKKEPTIDIVEAAIGEMERAKGYDPTDRNLQSYYGELVGQKEKLKSSIDQLHQEGLAFLEQKEWGDARQKFAGVLAFQPDHEEAKEKEVLATGNYLENLYQEGFSFVDAEEWQKAIENFNKILAINPDYSDVKDKLAEIRSKNNSAYHMDKGDEALNKGEWENAIKYFTKAFEFDPSEREIQEKLNEARIGFAEAHRQKGIEYASISRWREALEEFQQAEKIVPQFNNVKILRENARDQLVSQLYSLAENYESRELWGNAFVRYEEAAKLFPGIKNVRERLEDMKKKIRDRVILSVAVLDFGSPSDAEDAGALTSEGLVSYLFAHLDTDVKIVEREALQSIIKELSMGQTGILDMESAKEIGRITGVGILVIGKVLQYKTEHTTSEGTKTVQIQVGTKKIANPAYDRWLINTQKSRSAKLPPAPPSILEEPIHQLQSYKVGKYKAAAFTNVSFRVIKIEDGTIMKADTVKIVEAAEDDYVEGLDIAGVEYDPKILPTDTELLNKATERAINNSIGPSILNLLTDRDTTFLSKATQYREKEQHERAIEAYTNCVTVAEIKNKDSGKNAQLAQETIAEILKTP